MVALARFPTRDLLGARVIWATRAWIPLRPTGVALRRAFPPLPAQARHPYLTVGATTPCALFWTGCIMALAGLLSGVCTDGCLPAVYKAQHLGVRLSPLLPSRPPRCLAICPPCPQVYTPLPRCDAILHADARDRVTGLSHGSWLSGLCHGLTLFTCLTDSRAKTWSAHWGHGAYRRPKSFGAFNFTGG